MHVYDGATGREVGVIAGGDLIGAYLTPIDQLFVTSRGGELRQYDPDTLEPIRTFGGSLGFIQDVWGVDDGSIVAVKGGDYSVSLFDVATGVRLGGPISFGRDDDIYDITLSNDGALLAIGGGIESGYQLWDLDPDSWVAAACRMAGRNLTREEWATNIGNLAPYRLTCPELHASDSEARPESAVT